MKITCYGDCSPGCAFMDENGKCTSDCDNIHAREGKQCNKCKCYEGVHNVAGHAPCSKWGISVMHYDLCSFFDEYTG